MDIITKKIIIHGQVQMVGFRWFAKQTADTFHIKGFVRNTNRGDVEVLAQGQEDVVLTFIEHLKIGPSRARVDKIKIEREDIETVYNEFNIKM